MSARIRFSFLWKNIKRVPQTFGKNATKCGGLGKFALLNLFLFGQWSYLNKQRELRTTDSELLGEVKPKELVKFTQEAYEKAVKEKKNVIIFLNQGFNARFMIEFRSLIDEILLYNRLTRGKEMVILEYDCPTLEDMKEIANKLGTDANTTEETLLLLRNKYLPILHPVGFEAFTDKKTVLKYFRRIPKLNAKNFHIYERNLDQISSDTLFLFTYAPRPEDKNKDKEAFTRYKQQKIIFAAMAVDESFSGNSNLHLLLVNDQKSAKKIGFTDNVKAGDLLLVSKKSKYMLENPGTTTIKAGKTELNAMPAGSLATKDLFQSLTNLHTSNFLFRTSGLVKESPFSVILEIDRNVLSKRDYRHLINTFKQVKSSLAAKNKDLLSKVTFNVNFKDLKDAPHGYNILIFDVEDYGKYVSYFDDERPVPLPADQAKREELFKFLDKGALRSFHYRLPPSEEITEDSITKFINETIVRKQSAPGDFSNEFFRSKRAPMYQTFSKKLVGDTVNEAVLGDSKNHSIVFHYSKSCGPSMACGKVYEQLVKDQLAKKEKTNVEYFRVNGNKNRFRDVDNFEYTPAFVVYRKGYKGDGLVFRDQIFNAQRLNDFINLTLEYDIIPEEKEMVLFNSILAQRLQEEKPKA